MTTLATNSLPKFSQINIETIESNLDKILAKNRQMIADLLKQPEPFTWDNLMHPLEDIGDHLGQFWSQVSHLNAVMDSEKLRQVYNACIPKLSQYSTELSHNKKLYEAVQSIAESDLFNQLDYAQKKVIEMGDRIKKSLM